MKRQRSSVCISRINKYSYKHSWRHLITYKEIKISLSTDFSSTTIMFRRKCSKTLIRRKQKKEEEEEKYIFTQSFGFSESVLHVFYFFLLFLKLCDLLWGRERRGGGEEEKEFQTHINCYLYAKTAELHSQTIHFRYALKTLHL